MAGQQVGVAAVPESLSCLCRRRQFRICSLLTALLCSITAGQVAIYMVALWQNNWLVEQLSHNPLVGPSESTLHALGSLATSDLTDLHQYWRMVTSIFQCSGARPQIFHDSTTFLHWQSFLRAQSKLRGLL